jgi:hypothetical protein
LLFLVEPGSSFQLGRGSSGCARLLLAASVVIDSYSLGYQTAEPVAARWNEVVPLDGVCSLMRAAVSADPYL